MSISLVKMPSLKVRCLLVLSLVFLSLFQSQASEPSAQSPEASIGHSSIEHPAKAESYETGERLVYDISYLGVPAGVAVMEVVEKVVLKKEREAYHIVSTVRSNEFIDFFYPVNDRIESFIDVQGHYSHAIRVKQRQGGRKKDKVVRFDQVLHRAIQVKNSKVRTFLVPPRVQDSLSALYYFRTQNALEVGKSTFIDVHESKKNWKLEIKVLDREQITTPLGTFKTIKVKAFVRYEGVFMDKGDVTLWLTDDARHVPILIHTEIKIGHISATLRAGKGLPKPLDL